jgi:type VI secretion system protein ImpG
MDSRLLHYYEKELLHLRDLGREFAAAYPKVAGRLTLDQIPCSDPYVEHLLEAFAFLTARIHLKLDAHFPRFTQSLLETVYPDYLSPTPSLAIVQFSPKPEERSLAEKGFRIPRGTPLRSRVAEGDQTSCEYRTAHDLTIWPLSVADAKYHVRDLDVLELPSVSGVKAALRLRLACLPGLVWDELGVDRLTFFLAGTPDIQIRLYEQILAQTSAVLVQGVGRPLPWRQRLDPDRLRRVGFDDEHALWPVGPRGFSGYRLLREYFAFPQRFLFFEVTGLQAAVRRCRAAQLDLVFLLTRAEPALETTVASANFQLHCTPAINLFPKSCDRIALSEREFEFHVIPDRTRALDFELFQVTAVTGYGARADDQQPFRPFYSVRGGEPGQAYFTVHRRPRVLSERERRFGGRSQYAGSEAFISLVDGRCAPYRPDLRQLGVQALCTNRDLPLFMPVGKGPTDFTLETGAAVQAVKCVVGGAPTPPKPACAEGETAWRLISHLSLNYLSLLDSDAAQGAAALQALLELYGDAADPAFQKQLQGIQSVSAQPVVRRMVGGGPITFVRGLQITLQLHDQAFEGTGAFLLGSVLDQFFARYVSMNSFTETVVTTLERGRIAQWTPRPGQRHIL